MWRNRVDASAFEADGCNDHVGSSPTVPAKIMHRELEWQSTSLLRRFVRVQVPGGAPNNNAREPD